MLIVGLGNPGSEYKDNRHNVGFMAVDEIIRRHDLSASKSKFKGQLSEGDIAGQKIYAIKPATFMNKSGVCVAEIANFYKIKPEDIYVFYDELDIVVGKIKTKIGGGAGGHNGIRSIDSHIDKNYNRIRIGINHPGYKDKVHKYVLSNFSKKDKVVIDILLSHIAENIVTLLTQDNNNFATKLALAMQPAKPNKKATKPTENKKSQEGKKQNNKPKVRNAMDAALQNIFGNKGE